MTWYDNRFPQPEQTEEEFAFLTANFKDTDVLLEYGSGHSTPNLAPLVGKMITVDHHPDWYDKVKVMCAEYTNVEHVLVELDAPRIPPADWSTNPARKYGYPTPHQCVESYVHWPETQTDTFDKVLIDGRGRQWVAPIVRPYLNEGHELFVHDYPDRERYFTIEAFYDIIEVVGTMAKFRSKI